MNEEINIKPKDDKMAEKLKGLWKKGMRRELVIQAAANRKRLPKHIEDEMLQANKQGSNYEGPTNVRSSYEPEGNFVSEEGIGEKIRKGVERAREKRETRKLVQGTPIVRGNKVVGQKGGVKNPNIEVQTDSYDPTAEFADRVMNSLYEYDPKRGYTHLGRATPLMHITGKTSETDAAARRSAQKRFEREKKKHGEAGAKAREAVRTARRPGVSRAGQRFTDTELKGETGKLVDPETGDLTRKVGSRGRGAGGYIFTPNLRSRHYAKRKMEPKVDHNDMQDSYDPAAEFVDRVMNRVFEAFDEMSPEELAHYDANANKPGSQLGHRRDATPEERKEMAAKYRAKRRGPGHGRKSVKQQRRNDLRNP